MDTDNTNLDNLFEGLNEKSPEVLLLQKIDGFLKDLKEAAKLDDNEITLIDGIMTLHILEKKNQQSLEGILREQLSITKEKDVVDMVIKNAMDFFGYTANPPAAVAPSPADVLASLKARMTAPTAIAPVFRELPPGPAKPVAPTTATSETVPKSTPAPAPTPTPAPAKPKSKFDIYREQV